MTRREIKAFTLVLTDNTEYKCVLPASAASVLSRNGIGSSVISDEYSPKIESCSFVSKIELSEPEASAKYIYLRLDGVLANAELMINGRSAGLLNNSSKTYLFDIADKLSAGENTIEIKCIERLMVNRRITSRGEYDGDYDTAEIGDDLAIIGIPELYITNTSFVESVEVLQEHYDGRVSLHIGVKTLGDTDDIRAVASLTAPSGKLYFGGVCEDGIKIFISDPELWWPNGYGAQGLYKLTVTLYHGAEVADVYEKRIGLRTIELDISENSGACIKVNGVKIFSRGAAYMRSYSAFSAEEISNASYLISKAKEANMNTLVVVDEAIPFSDAFYDICDKNGLLVWQSVTIPYTPKAEAQNLTSALKDSAKGLAQRIANHPSVALTFTDFAVERDFENHIIPDTVKELRSVALKIIEPVMKDYAPEISLVGSLDELIANDERYLGVKDKAYAPKTMYSLPSEYTMRSYLSDGEYNLFSQSSEFNTNTDLCYEMLKNTFEQMKFPTGMAQLIYATELSVAKRLSSSIKTARRKGFSSAVMRQYNDGKPCVSASMMDFYNKPKAAMKFVGEAFAQTVLDIVPCINNTEFWVINSQKKDYNGKLVYALYDSFGKCYVEKTRDISVPPSSSILIEAVDFSKHTSTPQNELYISYELYGEKGILAKGTEHFVPLKHFVFNDPKIEYKISGMGKIYSIRLNASSYICNVKIDFEGLNVNFGSNFVDITDKMPVVINFETAEVVTLSELENKIRIFTPYGVGK